MCRLTSCAPHCPLTVPLEILVKTDFSFQISLTLSLFRLCLSIRHLFHLYLDCAECLFSLCAPITSLSHLLLIRARLLLLISCSPVAGLPYHKFTAWALKEGDPWAMKMTQQIHSPFLLSLLRPPCMWYFLFVQRIYIVCVCVNQKQWNPLAVSNQSISYTDERNKEFIIIFVPFDF